MSLENPFEKKETNQRNMESFFQPVFSLFAGQNLRLRIEENPLIKTAGFSYPREEIVINPAFYEEFSQKLPQEKEPVTLYVISHELMHFLQTIEDPKEYLRRWKLPEEWAKEGGEKNLEQRKEIWSELFNNVLDLNVKEKIEGNFIPFQERGTRGYLPQQIYQKVLFPETDFSFQPLCAQFCNVLLKEGVLEKGKNKISQEVKESLEKKISFFGEEITLQDLVYKHLKAKDTKVGTINFVIEKYLKPVFEELLKKDEQENRLPEAIKILVEGNFPSSPESKEIEKELAKFSLEKRRTAKEKEKELENQLFEEWASRAGFSEEEKQRLKEIIENSEKYTESLKKIWYQIIQITEEKEIERKAGYKIGAGVEPSKIVSQYPTILETPQEAEIFYRYLPESKEKILPRSIKVILILDMSSSMNEEKRKKVQEATYPLLRSLDTFQGELALNSPDGISPIKVESVVIGFGDKPIFLPEKVQEDPQIRIAQTIIEFQRKNLGGTQDNKALKEAENQFSKEDLEKIQKGELLGFVLEITDGETFTEKKSKELVRKINEKGILTKAIQIPGFGISPLERIVEKPLSREEEKKLRRKLRGVFGRVWGKHGQILASIEQLEAIILLLLEEVLRKEK